MAEQSAAIRLYVFYALSKPCIAILCQNIKRESNF